MSRQITILEKEINEQIEQLGNIFNTNFDFDYVPETVCLKGVTFENRQELIKNLKPNQKLVLKRDPFNKYDNNAIKVLDEDNNDLGWIPKDIAEIIAPEIDAGIEWKASIEKITGEEKQFNGVVVNLFYKNK